MTTSDLKLLVFWCYDEEEEEEDNTVFWCAGLNVRSVPLSTKSKL